MGARYNRTHQFAYQNGTLLRIPFQLTKDDIAAVQEGKRAIIIRIMNAITDNTARSATPNDKVILNQLTRDDWDVERAAWQVLNEIWRTQTHGIVMSTLDKARYARTQSGAGARPRGAMRCSKRLNRVVHALETDTTVAIDIMRARNVAIFVGNPDEYLRKKQRLRELASKGEFDEVTELCQLYAVFFGFMVAVLGIVALLGWWFEA